MPESVQPQPTFKVLIVEDNRDARTTLRMLLALGCGHTVLEAEDGATAIRIALDERPHVALIDLGLPGMSGCDVARRIRDALGRDDIFLIALTGHDAPEDRERTDAAGFDLHLVKPVESAALVRLLSERAALRVSNQLSD